MQHSPVTISALYALHGKARLRLTGTLPGVGFDFHAIAHEYLHEQEWVIKTIITREQFQARSSNPRQIIALHRFASYGNWAIVQIAERRRFSDALASQIQYSWRQWDLERNVELDLIKTSHTRLAFHEDHNSDA